MPYTALNSGDLAAGKPTKEEIFDTIKTNQDHFDSSISLLQGTSKMDVIDCLFGGASDEYTAAELTDLGPIFKAPADASFVGFVATLITTSTSGTLQLGIEKSTDNGVTWVSLLTAASYVEVTTSAVGAISGAVPWLDVPSQSFNQNDLIRLSVNSVQAGQGNFHVSIYSELS